MKLLIAAGADLNAKEARGKTPLQLAQWEGCHEAAKLLIAAGCKVS